MAFEDVKREWNRVLDNLQRALEEPNRPTRSTEGLMKQYGAMMVETSQRSFKDQRLGEWEWEPRYPGMEEPFINIAGALSDFNEGKKEPKKNRFQDRPALVDQGMRGGIWGSIAFSVVGPHDVEAGSNKPYAKRAQEGGESVTRVTEDGYVRGRDWLFNKNGEPRKGREGFVSKLWPSLFRRFLRQDVVKRPFVGVTPQLANDMIRATKEYFEREQGGGGLGGGRMAAAV